MLSSTLEKELEIFNRHLIILSAIEENQPIGIIRLAEKVELPQHKVRYSMRILEREGLVRATSDGAVATEKCREFQAKLPHLLERYIREITDLGRFL